MGHHWSPDLVEPMDYTVAASAYCRLDTQKACYSLWCCELPGEAVLRVVAGYRALPEGAAGSPGTMANYRAWKILTKSG